MREAGFVRVTVEIPIFKPLLAVLAARQRNGSDFVFPEAAELLESRPDSLTWRFKKIVAQAFGVEAEKTEDKDIVPASEVREEGEAAIVENVAEGPRRDRRRTTTRPGSASWRPRCDEPGHGGESMLPGKCHGSGRADHA